MQRSNKNLSLKKNGATLHILYPGLPFRLPQKFRHSQASKRFPEPGHVNAQCVIVNKKNLVCPRYSIQIHAGYRIVPEAAKNSRCKYLASHFWSASRPLLPTRSCHREEHSVQPPYGIRAVFAQKVSFWEKAPFVLFSNRRDSG